MTPRENSILVYQHKQPEYVPNFFTDFDVWDSFGERYFGDGTGDDWFGVNWTAIPEMHSQTETPGQKLIEDLENWRTEIHFPDLDAYDWKTIAAEATKNWDRTNKMSFCMLLNGPFERMMSLMGFENAMYAFYDYPEEVHELFAAITEHKCRYLEILKKYFDFDIIAFHDDWGNNQNMFFPISMWTEFIKPYIQIVIDKTHELGMFFEMHSCGYIKPTVEHLVDMGADAIDPLQYCNDVIELKEKFGDKIVFNGGFNSQEILEKPNATEEEIRQEVRRTIKALAPGGNFGTMCPIIDRNVAAIVADEISVYGKNFYKREDKENEK